MSLSDGKYLQLFFLQQSIDIWLLSAFPLYTTGTNGLLPSLLSSGSGAQSGYHVLHMMN